MKTKWLSRRIGKQGPHVCLCLSEKEYLAACKHLKLKYVHHWLAGDNNADAVAHTSASSTDGLCAIVCLVPRTDNVETIGLLIHESVHIWQEWCDYYGEKNPGSEQEAYGIQAISQTLIAEYERRVTK